MAGRAQLSDMAFDAASCDEIGALIAQDYYHADPYALDDIAGDQFFRLAKAQAGLVQAVLFTGFALGARRSWSHIRQAASNLYVIWFPLEGSLTVTQDEAVSETITCEQMVITYGDRPFHIRALGNHKRDRCSQLHILVPAHLMRSYLPDIDQICGKPFMATSGETLVAREFFSTLIREAQAIKEQSAAKLSDTVLETLTGHLKGLAGDDLNVGLRQVQLDRVLTFVQKHISTQGLTVERIAASCDISPRYVHYLMNRQGISLSQFLWKCRLDQSKKWLADPSFSHFNIVDIAYMAGFATPSHFSALFRKHFGLSPREVRRGASLALIKAETD